MCIRSAWLISSILLSLLLGGDCALSAEEVPAPNAASHNALEELKAPAAAAAVKRYNLLKSRATENYSHAVDSALAQLTATLKELEVRETKAGHLDDALKIRSALQYLNQPPVQKPTRKQDMTMEQLQSLLSGSQWRRLMYNPREIVQFNSDMSIDTNLHFPGVWAVMSGTTIRIAADPTNASSHTCTLDDSGQHLINQKGEIEYEIAKK